jgi:hypothetical protein
VRPEILRHQPTHEIHHDQRTADNHQRHAADRTNPPRACRLSAGRTR